MAVLTNKSIASTYTSLLSIGSTSTSSLSGSIQALTDGTGQLSPLAMSTTQIQFNTSTNTFKFPADRGAINQILKLADANGTLSWADDANSGTVTSVALSVPTGLTVTGSPITTSGTITIGGTLGVANGGTGATTLTGILVGNGTSAISAVTDGTVSGQVLSTNGSGTYSFIDAATGDVSISGTPVANQVAIWTDATTITGETGLIYTAGRLELNKIEVKGVSPKLSINASTSGDPILDFQDSGNTKAELFYDTVFDEEKFVIRAYAVDTVFERATDTPTLTIDGSNGSIKFNSYGSASPHTGTLAKTLGVDSSGNVIEFTAATGDVNVSGTPVDNQLAIWTDASTIEGNALLVADTTNNKLKIVGTGGNGIVINSTDLLSAGTGSILFEDAAVSRGQIYYTHSTDLMQFISSGAIKLQAATNIVIDGNLKAEEGESFTFITQSTGNSATTAVTIDSTKNATFNGTLAVTGAATFNGSVGIGTGTDGLTRNLTVKGTTTSNINIKSNASNGTSILSLGDENDDNYAQIILDNLSNKLQIQNGGGGGISNRGITLDSSENVGIGTSSPNDILDIRKANSQLRLTDSDDDKFVQFSYSGGKLITRNNSTNTIIAQVTLIENGNFGIGTDSPKSKLHVDGNVQMENDGMLSFYSGAGVGAENVGIKGSDATGTLIFYTEASEKMRISSGGDTTLTASHSGGTFPFRVGYVPTGTTTYTPTFVINDNGNVGIGTTSPSGQLSINNQVYGGVSPVTSYAATSGTDGQGFLKAFYSESTDGLGTYPRYLDIVSTGQPDGTNGGSNIRFFTNPIATNSPAVERMRITSAGDVLIAATSGATSATTLLSDGYAGFGVSGTGNWMVSSNFNDYSAYFKRENSNGGVVAFQRDGTIVGSISVSTTSTAYNTSSDYRLKENVTPITDALSRLNQLKPSRFNFISESDKTVDGFIAHEVESIIPEAISGEKDAVSEDGTPDYQGIDQSKIVPLLTAAIQEQQTIIEDLKSRIETLEG